MTQTELKIKIKELTTKIFLAKHSRLKADGLSEAEFNILKAEHKRLRSALKYIEEQHHWEIA